MPPTVAPAASRESSGLTDDSNFLGFGEHTALLRSGPRRFRRFFSGFVDFAFSGNVLDVAFGLMYVVQTLFCV